MKGPCPVNDRFKVTLSPLQVGELTERVAVGEVFTITVIVAVSLAQVPAPCTV